MSMSYDAYNKMKNQYGGDFDSGGGRVGLPFKTHKIHWYNGPGRQLLPSEENLPVMKFGGWNINVEKIDQSIPIPPDFVQNTLYSKDSKAFDVFSSRAVNIIPVLSRTAWFKATESTYQVLAYIFDRTKTAEGVSFVGKDFAVLQGKSYSGLAIQNAINSWSAVIRKSRMQYTDDLPPYWFIMPLGTFGPRQSKQVGKKIKSAIVPCQTIPVGQEIDEANLVSRLPHQEIIEVIEEAKITCKIWADDWNNQDWKEFQARQVQNDQYQHRERSQPPSRNTEDFGTYDEAEEAPF